MSLVAAPASALRCARYVHEGEESLAQKAGLAAAPAPAVLPRDGLAPGRLTRLRAGTTLPGHDAASRAGADASGSVTGHTAEGHPGNGLSRHAEEAVPRQRPPERR